MATKPLNRTFALFAFTLVTFTLLLLASCNQAATPATQQASVDFRKRLPEGQLALRKISPEQYPDFSIGADDAMRLMPAIAHSLEYLSAPSSAAFYPYLDITHDRAVASLKALQTLINRQSQSMPWNAAAFNQAVRDNFDVYQSIGAPLTDGSAYSDRVLFTGYCTPIYDASSVRTGAYQYPLYKPPADLVNDVGDQVIGRKIAEGDIVPYYTREEIETKHVLDGDELVWLTSRWQAYVVTIQGSARLRMTDGSIREVGFAGTNGYPYTSPEGAMLADHVVTDQTYNLKSLGDYFTAHPEAMDRYLAINQRYVFFTDRPGGPFGSLNVPVTALATIATDKAVPGSNGHDIYPRAMAAFLVVPLPTDDQGATAPFRGFMMDQDTGGAIRASGRCDIYMGIGDDAEKRAGHELQEGSLYYIAVKPGSSLIPGAGDAPVGNAD